MLEDDFVERIISLRTKKNVSAREMSLALGQNGSYINRIENKLTLPSLQAFFYICEYFQISPKEFFDEDNPNPIKINEIVEELKKMDDFQLDTIQAVINGLNHRAK
ncbi:MAG: helix-turn-helix domain-containing protein [Bacillus sp. (in: Bacteria)]|nr:helix-turn-helix domain-containing protein [Bacillus sp. (in: firmicutes)]MCM1426459.1 helix-turn-helix domain-containing protein [Eubacterium sp.]